MPRSDVHTLLDMALAARRVASFIQGLDQAAFMGCIESQSAVLYQLVILGEAVKRLSPAFRDQHHEIPWKKVAGMRDWVTHMYDDVDLQMVWDAATRDLPKLLASIEPMLPPSSSKS